MQLTNNVTWKQVIVRALVWTAFFSGFYAKMFFTVFPPTLHRLSTPPHPHLLKKVFFLLSINFGSVFCGKNFSLPSPSLCIILKSLLLRLRLFGFTCSCLDTLKFQVCQLVRFADFLNCPHCCKIGGKKWSGTKNETPIQLQVCTLVQLFIHN